jgi:hypothetical protein
MARVPRPRKSGQTGGSRYNEVNRSTHASARVYQKASKKSGCLSIIIVAVFIVTGAGFSVASLLL